MRQPPFQLVSIPGAFDEAGFAYGRACAEMVRGVERAYVDAMIAIHGVSRDELAAAAPAWAARLPEHYQAQMRAMAEGARVSFQRLAEFLYADISAPGRIGVHAAEGAACGPMCSSVLLGGGGAAGAGVGNGACEGGWVARNCDWYPQTLWRGTGAVAHATPHRIPSLALGIMGDLDCDTGVNAEGLWLHMHTLLARDEPRAGVSCISWLFWMREALETCATVNEVEAFIARTDRDRGVILLACDGAARGRGEIAIFECSRGGYERVEPGDARVAYGGGRWIVATNHPQGKHPTPEAWARRAPGVGRGSTVARAQRLRELMDHAHPERLPDDLIEVLADDEVEMRRAEHLRTIYSAVACPARREVWFAGEACPAASGSAWRRVPWPW